MGGIFLSDETKKDLNLIRKDVPKVTRRGKQKVSFSDIINFLIKFYKEAKK